jgi:perosamine synthetase
LQFSLKAKKKLKEEDNFMSDSTIKENLALFGGPKTLKTEFKRYNSIGKSEIESANQVLETGVLSGYVAMPGDDFLGGLSTKALEKEFCRKFKMKYAVSFNSATSALHASLVAAGVKEGDNVIVTPYTMSASATSAVMCGAKPVFVDIEPETFCMDVKQVENAVDEHTKAIMVVNIFGLSADLDPLRKLADTHGIALIEDNAQAPGATYQGDLTGTIGEMGIFSLNRHKTMQCGEGGVVICNEQRLAERLRLVRNHGEAVHAEIPEKERGKNDDIIGFNYRLTELQAAVALPQLVRLDELNQTRIDLADYLTKSIEQFNFLSAPKIRNGCKHVYYLYPMIYNPDVLSVSRDDFIKAMQAEGMPVANYVRPLYRLPLYRHRFGDSECYKPENFPVVEDLWNRTIITTPICHPPLTTKDIDLFVVAVKKIQDNRDQFRI